MRSKTFTIYFSTTNYILSVQCSDVIMQQKSISHGSPFLPVNKKEKWKIGYVEIILAHIKSKFEIKKSKFYDAEVNMCDIKVKTLRKNVKFFRKSQSFVRKSGKFDFLSQLFDFSSWNLSLIMAKKSIQIHFLIFIYLTGRKKGF